MSVHSDSLVLGSPQFEQARPAERAQRGGPLAGWREAVSGGALQAARQVKGDFAVALHESSGRVFMAVDRFAVHTLCYRQVGDALRFAAHADELAALSRECKGYAHSDRKTLKILNPTLPS